MMTRVMMTRMMMKEADSFGCICRVTSDVLPTGVLAFHGAGFAMVSI